LETADNTAQPQHSCRGAEIARRGEPRAIERARRIDGDLDVDRIGEIMEFITKEEREQLQTKLQELTAKRPVLSKRIAEARALGDLKENADYHAAREDQGMNEAAIRELEDRLKNSVISDEMVQADDIVFLGATVRLRELETDDEDLYKLVGESSGNFSMDYFEVTAGSPMGEALIKARVGDTVRVDTPKGVKRFEVLEIM
jgi:transcription elongation factor GreA